MDFINFWCDMKNREELIEVFKDTKAIIESKKRFNSGYCSSKKIYFAPKDIDIDVVNMDSVSAIMKYYMSYGRGYNRLCVLNMASAKKPGGGVERGEPTQEECLFRCSNLAGQISEELYPLGDNELILTQSSWFFKDGDYKDIGHLIPANVVTIPAINLNANSYFDKEKNEWVDGLVEKPHDYDLLLKRKIRAMLSVGISSMSNIMILGAWGCGVFKNHPTDIAYAFRDILVEEHFGSKFDKIVFPIINDENSTSNNFYYFEKILNNL